RGSPIAATTARSTSSSPSLPSRWPCAISAMTPSRDPGQALLSACSPRPVRSQPPSVAESKPKVLVKEKIAESGVELLRADFDVELGLEMSDRELDERIGEFDGIVIRSQTLLTAELIDRAARLKVIGRAGTGVDNVDVNAATKKGIVVVNA